MSNEVQVTDSTNVVTKIEKGLGGQIKRIGSLLDGRMKPEKFAALCVNAARQNPKLLQAFQSSPGSLFAAIQTCASMGLAPNSPAKECYLIPRWNKNIKANEATLQIGYHGLIKMARRDPQFKRIVARCVTLEEYEAGLFEYQEEPAMVRHAFQLGVKRTVELVNTGGDDYKSQRWDPQNLAGAYALVEMDDGATFVRFLDADQIAKRRANSSAPNGNFWRDHFEAMARKTALRALLESGEVPLNTELEAAVQFDQRVDDHEATEVAAEGVKVSVPEAPKEAPKITGAQEFGSEQEGVDNPEPADTGFGDGPEIPIDPKAKQGDLEWMEEPGFE